MKQFPLVSVIIPTYNNAQYVLSSIDSLLKQNYPNIEIIVVDDGSTDNTQDILFNFDERVKYIYQQNLGPAAARNKGILFAKGKYIAFNDADDLWAENRMFTQVAFMEKQPTYLACCGVDVWVKENFTLNDSPSIATTPPVTLIESSTGWQYLTLLKRIPYHIINLMLTKELAESISFDESLKCGEDYDYWIQISQKTQIAHIDQVFGFYRQRQGSITSTPRLKNDKLRLIDATIERFGTSDKTGKSLSKKELSVIYYHIHFCHGYELFNGKLYKESRRSFLKAMQYNPLRKGTYKYIIKSFFP